MQSEDNNIRYYDAAYFERYHSGKMTERERHEIEKAALDDPFLFDALDGYVHTTTGVHDVTYLRNNNKKITAVVRF